MAERVKRLRLDRAAPEPGAAEQRMQIRRRLAARGDRNLHGELAGGHHATAQNAGERRTSLLAREERLYHGGRSFGKLSERVRTAGDDDQDRRRPALQDRLDELALHAGQGEILRVVALAGCAVAEDAGPVSDGDDRELGSLRSRDRLRETVAARLANRAARREADLGVGQLVDERREQRRNLNAEVKFG